MIRRIVARQPIVALLTTRSTCRSSWRWAAAAGATVLLSVLIAPDSTRGQSVEAFTVLTADGRRTLPITIVNDRQMVAVDDLADVFDLAVREDALSGGLTITSRGQVIVLSGSEGLASVGGRLASLPSPPVRIDSGWLVPIEFISRALSPTLLEGLQLRRNTGLLIVGALDVPRVEVQYGRAGDQARVVLDVTPATPHTIERVGSQLQIRFEADALDAIYPRDVAGSLVAGIGPGANPGAVTIELGPDFSVFRSSELSRPGGSTRLVVNVSGSVTVADSVDPAAPGAPPPPAFPTAPARPLPELAPRPVLRTIAIDPGHGGEDTGAVGPDGTAEKDLTRQVAQRLRRTIETRLGVRVVLTRTGDQTVRLDERAAIANNNKADLFISLHANASVRPNATGAEVFFLNVDDYNDESLAAAEQDFRVNLIGGRTRGIEAIRWELAQVRYLEQSETLADIVTSELGARVTLSPRALQPAPLRVLVGANMPAVLIEMGFLSNPDQERELRSDRFQSALVEALFQSVIRYRAALDRTLPDETRVAPVAGDGAVR